MRVFTDLEQGTIEWFHARMGKLTASNASKILTAGGKPSTQARDYMYKLLGEWVTGEPEKFFTNDAMARGSEMEAEAREMQSSCVLI